MTTIYDNFATNFIIDNDYLYFNNDDDFTIYRMDLNTLQSKQIVDVDVDKYIVKDDFIYYNNAELYRTNLNTLESEKLTEHNVDGFLINGDYLFYLAKDDAKNEKGKLVIADLDGNEITSISDDRIDVLNSYIYAVNNTLYISGTSRTDKILVLDLKTLNFDELDYNKIEY